MSLSAVHTPSPTIGERDYLFYHYYLIFLVVPLSSIDASHAAGSPVRSPSNVRRLPRKGDALLASPLFFLQVIIQLNSYEVFLSTAFCTSRSHRCRPVPPPPCMCLHFCHAEGAAFHCLPINIEVIINFQAYPTFHYQLGEFALIYPPESRGRSNYLCFFHSFI